MGKAYFPMFVDISTKKIYCVGGGTIAARRVKTLVKFADDITVIAPKICDGMREMLGNPKVHFQECSVTEADVENGLLDSADMVLAATNDHELNAAIVTWCRGRKILVNTCDDKTNCDFYFPSVTEVDGVIIGLNSGGESPAKVRKVREMLEERLSKFGIHGKIKK